MQRSCPFSTQLPSVLIIRPLKRNERIGRGQVSCKAIRPIDHHPSDVRHASLKSDEAVLCRLFRAHDAPITAAVIVEDSDSEQRLVTSSYDQNLVFWRLQQDGLDTNRLEAARFACGHPVLSLAGDSDRAKDGKRSVYCARTGGDNDIVCWDPPKSGFNPKVCLGPHGGWVRDLQSYKKWMFSCDCNTLRQWDLTWTNPRHLRDVSLFKGDILSIAVGDYKVFVGVNDGTIHSWTITDNGELLPSQSIVAHKGRINSIAYGHGVLYSGGDDGHLKSWDGDTLENISAYNEAHDGKKINCVKVGPGSVIYTGAEDEGQIKRWTGKRLFPCQRPLFGHQASIRVLTFGSKNALVSGDAQGVVSIWKV